MKQIGVFLYPERSTNDYMLSSNGTVIFHPLSAYVEFKRNSIWYLKVEFPIADLHGKELPNEAIFKVDLTYAKNQFFRMIYKKIDRKKTHILVIVIMFSLIPKRKLSYLTSAP